MTMKRQPRQKSTIFLKKGPPSSN